MTARLGGRASLRRVVVLGAAILVMGSVLGAAMLVMCGGDAQHPAVGALNLTDGDEVWSVRSRDKAFRTVIGASEDVVLIEESASLVGTAGGKWHVRSWRTVAYDVADGSERWRRGTAYTPVPAGPIDGRGIVVLADQDAGALVGLDVKTGVERWRGASRDIPIANSPTVVVVWDVANPGTPSPFRGMDRLTGEELWVSDLRLLDPSADVLPPGIVVARSPATVLDEILVVPTGRTVTAIDMRTGAMLWQAPQLGHLAAADGTIVGQRAGNDPSRSSPVTITALDAASGEERWTVGTEVRHFEALAAGDGVVVIMDYINDQNWSILVLIAYELSSGTERWQVRIPPDRALPPHRISGTSLILRGAMELAVLSTTDGATIWSPKEPFGSDNIQPQITSVGSNGAAVFVASNSVPAACAPNCD